jgi:hypothetical protein
MVMAQNDMAAPTRVVDVNENVNTTHHLAFWVSFTFE